MKEQVILDRDEYLKLKELADKNQNEINNITNSFKGEFLKNLFDTIYSGVYDGHHDVLWGQEVDWPETNKEWNKYFRWFKERIEQEDWFEAIGLLRTTIREITKENRLYAQNEHIIKYMSEETKQNINKFNSIPWYKKIFYKI